MCLYPTLIKNRKYTANKKNQGIIPPITDERTKYVPIGCQECMECRKQKAREWQARLLEDIKTHKNGKFITLTFSNESIKKLIENPDNIKKLQPLKEAEGYTLDNAIATTATRLFLERWRKKYKTSLRHWLVTELGHTGTENIHIHGIIWTNETYETIAKYWQYGHIWPNDEYSRKHTFVNGMTVNYIIKYVHKIDHDHKNFKSKILTSPGIGANYTKKITWKENIYKDTNTNETYRTPTGHKISLPIYWRNKIYTEQEREKLWLQRLDKQERWICGEKVSTKISLNQYNTLLKYYQEKNRKLGYGNGQKNWTQVNYENQLRQLRYEERTKKTAAKEEHFF